MHIILAVLLSSLPRSESWATIETRTTQRNPSQLYQTSSSNEGHNEQPVVPECDVCIVGGSIAGLALSIGLRTRFLELHIALFERRQFTKAGAVLGVAPNGQKALRELSDETTLLSSILKEGQEVKGPPELNCRPMTVLVFWYQLRDILLEYSQQLGGNLSVYTQMELQEMTEAQDAETVTVSFQDTTAQKRRTTISAKLVVGADGINSTVRRLMRLPPAVVSDTTSIRGTVVTDHSNKSLCQKIDGSLILSHRDTTLYLITIEKNQNIISWALSSKTKNLIDDEGADTIEKILMLLGYHERGDKSVEEKEKLEVAAAVLRATDPENIVRAQNAVMDMSTGWGHPPHHPCATLVGDAAHACRPTDGQGGNMALEDGVVLCRAFAKHRSLSRKDVQALIQDFEQTRLPRVRRLHQDQSDRAQLPPGKWVPWTSEFVDWVHQGV